MIDDYFCIVLYETRSDIGKRVFLLVIGMKKIAIQGVLGSYHDIAAHEFFENEEIEAVCLQDK